MIRKTPEILRRFKRDENGQATIEAAICFPFIFAMMFACMEYGMFYNSATDLTYDLQDASRDAKLMDDPTQAQLLALYQGRIDASEANDVVLNVQRVTRYEEDFALVDMTYSYVISVPFLDRYPLTSTYTNLVLLSQDN